MEKVKEILLTAGKTALNSAVELGRSVVQLAARLGGTAASFVGKKTWRPGQGASPAPAAGCRRGIRRSGRGLCGAVADRAEEISLHVQ